VRENTSDVREPGAVARSQSLFEALIGSFARKIPYRFDSIDATVCQVPCLP
jgi:hypothetical protein